MKLKKILKFKSSLIVVVSFIILFLLIALIYFLSLGSVGDITGNVVLATSPNPVGTYNFNQYHSYATMVAELQQYAQAYPQIAKLYELATTWQGNKVYALKISSNVNQEENKLSYLFYGGTHGREFMGVEANMYLIYYLLNNYASNSAVANFVNGREIWVMPMQNPDGHIIVEKAIKGQLPIQYKYWKKNGRDLNSNGVLEYYDVSADSHEGVDVDKNFPFMWSADSKGGSVADPLSNHYPGPSPLSEPETNAERDLMISQHFTYLVDDHSYGGQIICPWEYKMELTKDHYTVFWPIMTEIAKIMNQQAGVSYYSALSPTAGLYPYVMTGVPDDYGYGNIVDKPRNYHFTIELNGPEGFLPAESWIERTVKASLEADKYILTDPANFAANLKFPSINGGGTWNPLKALKNSSNSEISWQINSAGDLNKDDVSDLFLQNSTGSVIAWIMNSDGTQKQTLAISNSPSSWVIRAAGDFNKDNVSDLVWQHPDGRVVLWLMNSDGTQKQNLVISNSPSSWVVKTAGDINNDSIADLVWQNSTGSVIVWFMNSDGTKKSLVYILSASTSWIVRAAGDINNDKIVDLVWQNSTGATIAWLMNSDGTQKQGLYISTASTSWIVKSAEDIDNDGISDLVWQFPVGNFVVVSFLNSAPGSSVQTPLCLDSDWTSSLSPLECPSSQKQTQTWTKIGTCSGGVQHPSSEIVNCSYQAPSCSYNYSEWSSCNSSGIETRTVVSALPLGCQGIPALTRTCEYFSPCDDLDWQYSDSSCNVSNSLKRTWTKIGNCNQTSGINKPSFEIINCTYTVSNSNEEFSDTEDRSTRATNTPRVSTSTNEEVTNDEAQTLSSSARGIFGSKTMIIILAVALIIAVLILIALIYFKSSNRPA